MDERYPEIEDLEKRDQQIMYSKVSDPLGKEKRNKNIAIKRADGRMATDIKFIKILGMWQSDDRQDADAIAIFNSKGTTKMREEVRVAIEEIKTGKAVGGDDAAAKVLKALGDFAVDQLTSLFQQIYETGNLIYRMYDSVFVSLP